MKGLSNTRINAVLIIGLMALSLTIIFFAAMRNSLSAEGMAVSSSGDGSNSVVVMAKGTAAGGVYAHFQVYAGTTKIGEAYTTGAFTEYTFKTSQSTGKVMVRFDNDAIISGSDRNLYVDHVTINGVEYSSESAIMDLGSLGGYTTGGSKTMPWKGYLIFTLTGSESSTSTSSNTGSSQTIVVRAKGSAAGGKYAHFQVLAGSVVIGEKYSTETYTDYTFKTSQSTSRIMVHYDNDAIISLKDRNLYIESITVGSKTYLPNQARLDIGKLGGPTIAGKNKMSWNSYLIIDTSSSTSTSSNGETNTGSSSDLPSLPSVPGLPGETQPVDTNIIPPTTPELPPSLTTSNDSVELPSQPAAIPTIPSVPSETTTQTPEVPSTPSVPNVPSETTTQTPEVPSTPSVPNVPSETTTQTPEVSSTPSLPPPPSAP